MLFSFIVIVLILRDLAVLFDAALDHFRQHLGLLQGFFFQVSDGTSVAAFELGIVLLDHSFPLSFRLSGLYR